MGYVRHSHSSLWAGLRARSRGGVTQGFLNEARFVFWHQTPSPHRATAPSHSRFLRFLRTPPSPLPPAHHRRKPGGDGDGDDDDDDGSLLAVCECAVCVSAISSGAR